MNHPAGNQRKLPRMSLAILCCGGVLILIVGVAIPPSHLLANDASSIKRISYGNHRLVNARSVSAPYRATEPNSTTSSNRFKAFGEKLKFWKKPSSKGENRSLHPQSSNYLVGQTSSPTLSELTEPKPGKTIFHKIFRKDEQISRTAESKLTRNSSAQPYGSDAWTAQYVPNSASHFRSSHEANSAQQVYDDATDRLKNFVSQNRQSAPHPSEVVIRPMSDVKNQSLQNTKVFPTNIKETGAEASPPARLASHIEKKAKPLSPSANTIPVDSKSPPSLPELETPRNITGPSLKIPLQKIEMPKGLNMDARDGRISLVARDVPINTVLETIARQHGMNVVLGDGVDRKVSVNLNDVALEDALHAILTINGYTWIEQRNILLVTKADHAELSPVVQGRQLRVFDLNFLSAADVDSVVKGLLSPAGKSFILETNSKDKRRTQERIIVEDLPEYVARVASYIRQVDCPPRQVLIEAHVLRVGLRDDTRHGVNMNELLRLANSEVRVRTEGFANPLASPAFFLSIDGTDIESLVEALTTTTDAKTLASPKLMVLNGQQAKIQVGEQLGYLVTTTTKTATLQNVEFLDLGVVLAVTPTITDDGRVILTVKPEVSNGRINPATGLPEEETTEVETTIMLPDGQGMVIGGLIREEDVEIESKIPIAGDLFMVGRMFQRRSIVRERAEVIIALIPRIVPYDPTYHTREHAEYSRVATRLLHGPLHRIDRTLLEPELPDAKTNPRRVQWKRLPHTLTDFQHVYPRPVDYYFPVTNGWVNPPWFPPYLTDGETFDERWAEPLPPAMPGGSTPPPHALPTPADPLPQ